MQRQIIRAAVESLLLIGTICVLSTATSSTVFSHAASTEGMMAAPIKPVIGNKMIETQAASIQSENRNGIVETLSLSQITQTIVVNIDRSGASGDLTIEQLKAIEKSLTADNTLITVIFRNGTINRVPFSDFHPTTADNATIAIVMYPKGIWAVVHVPPNHFNPLTASNTELDYYNYPPRPKNPDDQKRWESVMSHAQQFVIPVLGAPTPQGDLREVNNGPEVAHMGNMVQMPIR